MLRSDNAKADPSAVSGGIQGLNRWDWVDKASLVAMSTDLEKASWYEALSTAKSIWIAEGSEAR